MGMQGVKRRRALRADFHEAEITKKLRGRADRIPAGVSIYMRNIGGGSDATFY